MCPYFCPYFLKALNRNTVKIWRSLLNEVSIISIDTMICLATIQKAAKARASSSSALDIVISTEDLSSIPDRVEAKGNITILDEILDQAYLSSLLDRV